MDDLCHRCGGELPRLVYPGGQERSAPHGLEPEALLFCPHCSAPQIRLPEHMRPLAAAPNAVRTTGSAPPPHPHSVAWPVALQSAAAVAVVGAGLYLLGAALHALGGVSALVSIIAFVWITSCAFFTLSQYIRRRPDGWMDARAGFRIGVASALLMLALLAPAVALTGVVRRFGTHSLGGEDAQAAAQTEAMGQRFQQWMKDQGATAEEEKQFAQRLQSPQVNSPEARAGGELAGMGIRGALLLLYAGGTGALAGAAGARRRRLVLHR